MDTLLLLAIVALGIVALVVTIGAFTPRKHAVSVRAKYARTPAEVWSTIVDVEAIPTWHEAIVSVERRPDVDGLPSWVEHTRRARIPLRVEESVPPRKLVVRIDDEEEKQLPFGGTWTWHLREVPGGCEVTLTENGFVNNVLFRVIAHYFLGYTRMLVTTLRSLGQKFGESTEPRVV